MPWDLRSVWLLERNRFDIDYEQRNVISAPRWAVAAPAIALRPSVGPQTNAGPTAMKTTAHAWPMSTAAITTNVSRVYAPVEGLKLGIREHPGWCSEL
ncbi:hypothetical protein N7468_010037 [Penicillium chermesinum]|uniref:Uncharacterized protein n=1 Tax=Penicillium chermesinum TaxID=63820 RepID=A0A9W9NDP3_9EURO|nr:uncharacterized protein N7468_010037 [Penicillium chermesinum]KAJ5217029.1 hypothetical protein N7468_010037 [Penicillium chermesinum]KAJ6171361.1 hypothetical protein N7470_000428 [Penicillium chermesinum]